MEIPGCRSSGRYRSGESSHLVGVKDGQGQVVHQVQAFHVAGGQVVGQAEGDHVAGFDRRRAAGRRSAVNGVHLLA